MFSEIHVASACKLRSYLNGSANFVQFIHLWDFTSDVCIISFQAMYFLSSNTRLAFVHWCNLALWKMRSSFFTFQVRYHRISWLDKFLLVIFSWFCKFRRYSKILLFIHHLFIFESFNFLFNILIQSFSSRHEKYHQDEVALLLVRHFFHLFRCKFVLGVLQMLIMSLKPAFRYTLDELSLSEEYQDLLKQVGSIIFLIQFYI